MATFTSIADTLRTIKAHLVAQGKRAKEPSGPACLYATSPEPDALRCAVGCLFPPEVGFKLNGEGTPLDEPIRDALVEAGYPAEYDRPTGSFVSDPFIRALEAAQKIHDSYDPREWPARMDALIAQYEGK